MLLFYQFLVWLIVLALALYVAAVWRFEKQARRKNGRHQKNVVPSLCHRRRDILDARSAVNFHKPASLPDRCRFFHVDRRFYFLKCLL